MVATASNRVDSVQDGASATLRTLTWRTGGDLAQAAYAGGSTFDYEYNARKRLSLVKLNTVDRAQYGYDFRGLRVWADTYGASAFHSHYVFDEDGHVLAQHDGATGAVLSEYIWLDDTLLAVIDSSTMTVQTFFVHTGQLDEPLVMTDATKAKVWDAYVEPYGLAQMFAAPSVGLLVRLPGQWQELEAGDLSQNWHRNYDPSLGRYIEADPLGIEAGQSLYAYVDGDPLRFRDAKGLDIWIEGPSGGGIEPAGHQAINVGNPNGIYNSYSFGVNGDAWLGGEVYSDPLHGGAISPDHYLKTTAAEDKRANQMLAALLGKKAPYRPWRTCRNFSQEMFEKFRALKFGKPAKPPVRPVPADAPPATVSPSISTLASDRQNGRDMSSSGKSSTKK